MTSSANVRFITVLQPGKDYKVIHVYRLRHTTERHYVVHVWERVEFRVGRYILPRNDFFCDNDIIQINQSQMDSKTTFQGLGPSGDPIVHLTKIPNPLFLTENDIIQINNHVFTKMR
jgi:hypothetical protein